MALLKKTLADMKRLKSWRETFESKEGVGFSKINA